jgi:hypothetical protein
MLISNAIGNNCYESNNLAKVPQVVSFRSTDCFHIFLQDAIGPVHGHANNNREPLKL